MHAGENVLVAKQPTDAAGRLLTGDWNTLTPEISRTENGVSDSTHTDTS